MRKTKLLQQINIVLAANTLKLLLSSSHQYNNKWTSVISDKMVKLCLTNWPATGQSPVKLDTDQC